MSKLEQILSYKDKLDKLSDMQMLEVYIRSKLAYKHKHPEELYLTAPISEIIDMRIFNTKKKQPEFYQKLLGTFSIGLKEVYPRSLKHGAELLRKYYAQMLQGCSGVIELSIIDKYLKDELKVELKQ